MWSTTEIPRGHPNRMNTPPRTSYINLHYNQRSPPTQNIKPNHEHPLLQCIDPNYHQYLQSNVFPNNYSPTSSISNINDMSGSMTPSESTVYSNSTGTSDTSCTISSDLKHELIGYDEEDLLFVNNGFRKLERLNASDDTSGIQLFKAEQMHLIAYHYPAVPVECYAFIKKIHKQSVHKQGDENIVKEATVLSHLTVDNKSSIANHLVKFLDFFESDNHYYLITEYVEGMTLKRFIRIGHEYVKKKRWNAKDLKRVMKYLMFQLLVTLRFLHDVYHCCHLNLLPENIILQNSKFVKNADGSVSLSNNIGLKVAGFGVAEVFDISNGDEFKCCKHATNSHNHYDGRSADMWSYGMIFYQCMTGKVLNTAQALKNGDLVKYLEESNLANKFTKDSLNLMCRLLNLTQRESVNALSCLQDGYFKSYLKRYEDALNKKMKKDTLKLQQNREKMIQFPYYKMSR